MFVWGVLKHRILESLRFCIGNLPMYIFFILTHPYFEETGSRLCRPSMAGSVDMQAIYITLKISFIF